MIKFICPVFSRLPEPAELVLRISRASIEAAGHRLDIVQMQQIDDQQKAAIAKDLYVLDLLQREECAVIDWDVEISSVFQPPADGRPWMIYEWGTPRIGYMISLNAAQFFLDLQAEKIRRGIQDVFGYPNKLFRDKNIGMIPEETYFHHRFTSGDKQ
jgi:hypothetical protein